MDRAEYSQKIVAMNTQLAIPTMTAVERMPLEQVLSEVYPAALLALDKADGAAEANEVRARIEAVVTYVNRMIPMQVRSRAKQLKVANRGNRTYLEACRIVGHYWELIARPPGRPKTVHEFTVLSPEEAGFADRWDARRCVKASLLHEEDLRTYFLECDKGGRQYTLSGLVSVFDLLNPGEGGEGVEFSTRPLAKFLSDTAVKIEKRAGDVAPEVQELMLAAASSLREAIPLVPEEEPKEEINEPGG
jgi:hypothetical protein